MLPLLSILSVFWVFFSNSQIASDVLLFYSCCSLIQEARLVSLLLVAFWFIGHMDFDILQETTCAGRKDARASSCKQWRPDEVEGRIVTAQLLRVLYISFASFLYASIQFIYTMLLFSSLSLSLCAFTGLPAPCRANACALRSPQTKKIFKAKLFFSRSLTRSLLGQQFTAAVGNRREREREEPLEINTHPRWYEDKAAWDRNSWAHIASTPQPFSFPFCSSAITFFLLFFMN